jgi:hypothetical protein
MNDYPGLIGFCKAHRHEGVNSETGESGFTLRVTEVKETPKGRVFKKNE